MTLGKGIARELINASFQSNESKRRRNGRFAEEYSCIRAVETKELWSSDGLEELL